MTKRSGAFHPVSQPSISNSIFYSLFFVTFMVALASMPAHAQDVETPTAESAIPGVYNPLADPKAIVTADNARFTILTPRLIRMEWAADGKFEDHASLVFLNRSLPVPKFGADRDNLGAVNIRPILGFDVHRSWQIHRRKSHDHLHPEWQASHVASGDARHRQPDGHRAHAGWSARG